MSPSHVRCRIPAGMGGKYSYEPNGDLNFANILSKQPQSIGLPLTVMIVLLTRSCLVF
ncbi:hypothetical protein PhaeoP14_03629 (plasmid) [Phaeobacter piscinae]|nr:hypothetical protein PhaeoP14_03629 [Phaeobacter piscinae]